MVAIPVARSAATMAHERLAFAKPAAGHLVEVAGNLSRGVRPAKVVSGAIAGSPDRRGGTPKRRACDPAVAGRQRHCLLRRRPFRPAGAAATMPPGAF